MLLTNTVLKKNWTRKRTKCQENAVSDIDTAASDC